MAKVTMNPAPAEQLTPTQRIVAGSVRDIRYVTDARGRVLGVRKLSALERMRVVKAVAQFAAIDRYLGMAVTVASVAEIDGVPQALPMNDRQVEAIIATLDDDGIDAVQPLVTEIYGGAAEGEIEAAKNS